MATRLLEHRNGKGRTRTRLEVDHDGMDLQMSSGVKHTAWSRANLSPGVNWGVAGDTYMSSRPHIFPSHVLPGTPLRTGRLFTRVLYRRLAEGVGMFPSGGEGWRITQGCKGVQEKADGFHPGGERQGPKAAEHGQPSGKDEGTRPGCTIAPNEMSRGSVDSRGPAVGLAVAVMSGVPSRSQ